MASSKFPSTLTFFLYLFFVCCFCLTDFFPMEIPKLFLIELCLSFVHIHLSARPNIGLYAGPLLGVVMALIKVTQQDFNWLY